MSTDDKHERRPVTRYDEQGNERSDGYLVAHDDYAELERELALTRRALDDALLQGKMEAQLAEHEAAQSSARLIPDGWKLERQGTTIWISSPDFLYCGVGETGKGDAPDMLYALADTLLKADQSATREPLIEQCAAMAENHVNRVTGSDEYWKGRRDAAAAVRRLKLPEKT